MKYKEIDCTFDIIKIILSSILLVLGFFVNNELFKLIVFIFSYLLVGYEVIFKAISNFFKLLGDSTRLKILFTIDKEDMCVCDIANALSMTKSAVSHQLATLRRSGIVKCYKVGKEVYYTLDDFHVNKVFEIALEHIEHKG